MQPPGKHNRRHFAGLAAASAAGAGVFFAKEAASAAELGLTADGLTDITNDLQRAVDNGAGTLFFPRGLYRLSGTVTVDLDRTGYTSLFAHGNARFVKDGPGPAFHFIGTHEGTAGPSSFEERVWERQRMPLLSGIEIEGRHPESVGVRLEKIMQPTLTSVCIRRCHTALHLVKRNRNLVVAHCHFYHNLELGIHFDHVNLHQAIVADSHISYNRQAGIKMEGGEIRNLQIAGNDIEYNYAEDIEDSADLLFDVRGEGSSFREAAITGNTIQARPSPGGANIRVLGGKDLRSGGLMTIAGNMIGSQTDNIHLRECRGVTVAGNIVYSAADRSILVEDCDNIVLAANSIDWNPDHRGKVMVDGIALVRCRGVQLSDTVIENSFHGSEEAGGTIEIADCEDVGVSDCQIIAPRHRGIVIVNSLRCSVSGCRIVDKNHPQSMKNTIQVIGGRDHFISGNVLQKGMHEIAEETAVFEGNHEVEVTQG